MTLSPGEQKNGYVIFRSPAEYPGKYVVRIRRKVGEDDVLDATPFAIADDLETARSALQETDCLLCLPRAPVEDRAVVETWI